MQALGVLLSVVHIGHFRRGLVVPIAPWQSSPVVVCLFDEVVCNVWQKGEKSNWCPKGKKKTTTTPTHGINSIELICLNGCLGSYLKWMANFNSILWSTVEPFCLKIWTKETIPGRAAEWRHAPPLDGVQGREEKWEILVLADIAGCREAHKSWGSTWLQVATVAEIVWRG